MEEILLAVEPSKQALTSHPIEPVKAPATTDWHTYYSTANKAKRRSVPKVHTRNPSISATMDLPWTIDNTSSSPQTSHNRNPSLTIPPPPKAGEIARNSISNSAGANTNDTTTITAEESPKLHPLMTRVQQPTSPTPYTHSSAHTVPSPYSSTSTTSSRPPHNHSLAHPPGYTQNTQAHTSFSTIQTTSNTTSNSFSTNYSHSNSNSQSYTQPTTPSTSRPSSSYSSYSPTDKSAPPIYNTNTSPFYSNSTTNSAYDYSNSLFSPTFSFTAPSTPKTPASTRRGILDNDPAIYLARDGENGDDESIWDTATKWARLASKKLSMGGDRNGSGARGPTGEFSVSSGLWKMVAGVGEERRDVF